MTVKLTPEARSVSSQMTTEPVPFEDGIWRSFTSESETLDFDVSAVDVDDWDTLAVRVYIPEPLSVKLYVEFVEADGTRCKAQNIVHGGYTTWLRIPLSAFEEYASSYTGYSKPTEPVIVMSHPIHLESVDRISIGVSCFPFLVETPEESGRLTNICFSPLELHEDERPPDLDRIFPAGPAVDEFGQLAYKEWRNKTHSEDELVCRLRDLRETATGSAASRGTLVGNSQYSERLESTGYFRTQRHDGQWMLVDPDGNPFWSIGVNHVSPHISSYTDTFEDAYSWIPSSDGEYADARDDDSVSFIISNLIRAFGDDEWLDSWADLVVSLLRHYGFNTIGNWSSDAVTESDLPYVRELDFTRFFERDVDDIYHLFPDVYHPDFRTEAERVAASLRSTATDPSLIGYFITNQPRWMYSVLPPAAGMLYTTETCESRRAFADYLREKYDSNDQLASVWGKDVTFASVEAGRWTGRFPPGASEDAKAFSGKMLHRMVKVISEACSKVDPNHLNLGIRIPTRDEYESWFIDAFEHVDVLSINDYSTKPLGQIDTKSVTRLNKPILITEWQFGALDVGLSWYGKREVLDQAHRGRAYQQFVERAASMDNCIGVHWHQLYDFPVAGHGGGGAGNMGLLDVCSRPYAALLSRAKESNLRLYDIAFGDGDPGDFSVKDYPSFRE